MVVVDLLLNNTINMESVKIETEVLNRIRPHVKEKGLILSRFISTELAKIMDKIEKRKQPKL